MPKACSFVFYESYLKSADSLKDDKAFRELIDAICKYGLYGEITEFKTDYVEAIFNSHKVNIDYAIARRKQYSENGSKGGAPEGNQNARKQPKTTKNNRGNEENNLNEDVDEDADANADEEENDDPKDNDYVEIDEDRKGNEIPKSKGRGRTNLKNLKASELGTLFPEEDINFIDSYYTKLKENGFRSLATSRQIKTKKDMIEDLKNYKRFISDE